MNDSSSFSTEMLAADVLKTSEQLGFHIAAAESLTGGLLADAFVSVPGASRVFCGSAVTYDIHAKAKILGVSAQLLKTEGAVYQDVAMQMAVGASRIYRGSGWEYEEESECGFSFPVVGLSTTGVAGPGPDGDKPAGLVYVGVLLPQSCDLRDGIVRECNGFLDLDCFSRFWDYSYNEDVVIVFELHLLGDREQVRCSTVHSVVRVLNGLLDFVKRLR